MIAPQLGPGSAVSARGEAAGSGVATAALSALAAARQWRFRPSRVAGRTVGTYVYLIFGFAQPITFN